jgi:hypothetical protein
VKDSEATQPASPFQLEISQQDTAGPAKSEGLDSVEVSDGKLEPRVWNPLDAGASLLGRVYHTQTSLKSTESTLSYYPTFGSLNSSQAATIDQAFPPSDLAWIDEPQAPSNTMLYSAPVTYNPGNHHFPQQDANTGGRVSSLTRSFSETLLDAPAAAAGQGDQRSRREGLRPMKSLPKRKYRASDADLSWEGMAGEDDPAGTSPRSSDGEGEDVDMGEDEQRRQRRRSNNRESAMRIKEKRHADLREVSDKVERLQAEQARLVGQCSSMQDSCLSLQRELQELKGRWGENQAENQRLTTELHHLRRNVSLGSSAGHSGNQEHHVMASSLPNGFFMPGQAPGMQHGGAMGYGGYNNGPHRVPMGGGHMAAEPTWQPGHQTNNDQDWRNWG